jgi:hypothetical protein
MKLVVGLVVVSHAAQEGLLLGWLGTAQPLGIEGRAGHHFK